MDFITKCIIPLLIIPYLPTTVCQCMEHIRRTTCYDDQDGTTARNLLECIEPCLFGKKCVSLQWNQRTKDCWLSHDLFIEDMRDGDCICLKKSQCSFIPDIGCLKADHSYAYDGGLEIKGFNQEKQCQILCVTDKKCIAYTWLGQTLICKLHQQPQTRSSYKLKDRDGQGKKTNTMHWTQGRCGILRIGANSGNGKRDDSANTLKLCLEQTLNKDGVLKVDWDINGRSCWVHRSYARVHLHVGFALQVQKNGECSFASENEDICLKKHKNKKMAGAYYMTSLSEKSCTNLCKALSNCAAVEWNSRNSKCGFHQFQKDIIEGTYINLFTVDECLPEVSTPRSTTYLPPPTSLTRKSKHITGAVQWSFYRRKKWHTMNNLSLRVAQLKCAVMCHSINCTSFTCTSAEGCVTYDTDIGTYSPLLC